MSVSDYQMGSVVKTYMKTVKAKLAKSQEVTDSSPEDNEVHISTEAIKKMMYKRVGEQISDKIKKLNPLGTKESHD